MLLVEHDHVVQALSTERPDDTLGDCIRIRRADRSQDGVDADTQCLRDEVGPVAAIPIASQMPRLCAPRCRLAQLALDPIRRRMPRHVDMHDAAPFVRDEHDHVQGTQRQRRHREEIDWPDVRCMVVRHDCDGGRRGAWLR